MLARNGRAGIGDLRYLAEEKLDDFKAPLARAQLAASLAFTGDQALADTLFRDAVGIDGGGRIERMDYGTPVRDAAAIVTLAAESRVPEPTLATLSQRLRTATQAASDRAYSTQEAAWLLLSAHAREDTTGLALIGAEEVPARGVRSFSGAAAQGGITVKNLGDQPLSIAATVTGTPLAPLPPVSSGLEIVRSHHTLDGAEVALAQVAQNERIIVRLSFRKRAEDPMRLMLTDLLPAGFEVENPRLMAEADLEGLPLGSAGQSPVYTEFRDDRFAAAFTLSRGPTSGWTTVSYMVRAISPGTFTLPAAEVSDMYQPRFVARTAPGSVVVVPTR